MKTTLLRRLRRKANKEFYVTPNVVLRNFDIAYDIMHREPLVDCPVNTVWNSYVNAEKMLNEYRRQYIIVCVRDLRFKKLYK